MLRYYGPLCFICQLGQSLLPTTEGTIKAMVTSVSSGRTGRSAHIVCVVVVLLLVSGCLPTDTSKEEPPQQTPVASLLLQVKQGSPKQKRYAARQLVLESHPDQKAHLPALLSLATNAERSTQDALLHAIVRLGPTGWKRLAQSPYVWAQQPSTHWRQAMRRLPTKQLLPKALEAPKQHWLVMGWIWRWSLTPKRARWLLPQLSHTKPTRRAAATLAFASSQEPGQSTSPPFVREHILPRIEEGLQQTKSLSWGIASLITWTHIAHKVLEENKYKKLLALRPDVFAWFARGLKAKDPLLQSLTARRAGRLSPWGLRHYEVWKQAKQLLPLTKHKSQEVQTAAWVGFSQLSLPGTQDIAKRNRQRKEAMSWLQQKPPQTRRAREALQALAKSDPGQGGAAILSAWAHALPKTLMSTKTQQASPALLCAKIQAFAQLIKQQKRRWSTLAKLPTKSQVQYCHIDTMRALWGFLQKTKPTQKRHLLLVWQRLLINAVKAPHPDVQRVSLLALHELGPDAAPAAQTLQSLWGQVSHELHQQAMLRVFAAMKDKAAPALGWLLAISHKAPLSLQKELYKVFAAIGPGAYRALPTLQARIQSLLQALLPKDTPKQHKWWQDKRINRGEKAQVLQAALQAVTAIKGHPPAALLPAFLKLLSAPSLQSLAIGLLPLWKKEADKVVPALVQELNQFKPETKEAVGLLQYAPLLSLFDALGQLGESARAAVPALQMYLSHRRSNVRFEVSHVLANIGLQSKQQFAGLVRSLPTQTGSLHMAFRRLLANECLRFPKTCEALIRQHQIPSTSKRYLLSCISGHARFVPALGLMLKGLQRDKGLDKALRQALLQELAHFHKDNMGLVRPTLLRSLRRGPKRTRWLAAVTALQWKMAQDTATKLLVHSLQERWPVWTHQALAPLALALIRRRQVPKEADLSKGFWSKAAMMLTLPNTPQGQQTYNALAQKLTKRIAYWSSLAAQEAQQTTTRPTTQATKPPQRNQATQATSQPSKPKRNPK